MKTTTKIFSIVTLLVLASFVFAPVALAFDGRSAERIIIGKDEVINDDLYLAGQDVIVDGTINGDLLAAGNTVIINGTVTGDVWAAGRTVDVNGQVGDDLFAAAAAVTIGPDARIADDVFSAASGVEARAGSQIGGSLFIGAFQGLASGEVAEDLMVGANRLRLEGAVGRNARVAVEGSGSGFNPQWSSDMPELPYVPGGLTFGSDASVEGSLEYTSQVVLQIPASVAAQVTHKLPPVDAQVSREVRIYEGLSSPFLSSLRHLVALLLIGLLLAKFAPAWIQKPAGKLQSRPWPSLGVGFLGLVASPFVFLTLLVIVILVAILLGALTLGELVGVSLGLGLTGFFTGAVLFTLMLGYVPQAAVAYLGGRWILQRLQPEASQNFYYALLLGLVILGVIIAIPVLGGVINFLVILAGLGAILLLLFERRQQPAAEVIEA